MSMPKFPDVDLDMSSESALNMILVSISMEELALSHIINAEGEKLQFAIKNLETCCGIPDLKMVLKVNQSVTDLLDSVSNNQIILKNKMDKALRALTELRPSCTPPVSYCSCKCSAYFRIAEHCSPWQKNTALYWRPEHLHGKCISYDVCDRAKILCSKGRFAVSFSVNVKARDGRCNACISLQSVKNHHCEDLYTVHSPVMHSDNFITISTSNIIIENYDYAPSLYLMLESPDCLIVEEAVISIIEI